MPLTSVQSDKWSLRSTLQLKRSVLISLSKEIASMKASKSSMTTPILRMLGPQKAHKSQVN